MFDNYRCRICGQYISIERRSELGRSVFDHCDNVAGMIFTNKDHPHCTLIEEDEHVYCDHISYSMNPLERSIDVLILKGGKYELTESSSKCK